MIEAENLLNDLQFRNEAIAAVQTLRGDSVEFKSSAVLHILAGG